MAFLVNLVALFTNSRPKFKGDPWLSGLYKWRNEKKIILVIELSKDE